MEATTFTKNSILDVWKDSEYVLAQSTIKPIIQHKANTNHIATLKQATYVSVLNHWKIFETTLTTESNEQNQITYLQSQLFHTIQDLLWLTILSLFTIISIWCTHLQAYWNSHKFSLIILSNLQPSFISMLFFKKEKERLKISIIQ